MNKRKYAQLSLSLAAMLMAAPVWAAEQNQSAADVVANQTMTIGGKEQIVSQKALEQARKAQEESGKSFPKKGKDGKYTYYMHNNPSEDISDPNYKSDGTKKSGGRIVEIVPGKGVVREGGSGIEKEDAAKGSETSAAENAQQGAASEPYESGVQAVTGETAVSDEADGQITAGESQSAEVKEPMIREADGSLRPMTVEERQKWQAEQEQQRTAQEAMQQNAQTNAMAQEPVLNMPVAQQRRASEPAAPYIGQLVTKISVKGNKITKAEDIEAVVTTKPGMQLTQEGLAKDLHAIYGLGWYYDLQPEFTKVPEGVQLTYHVLENPVYKKLEVEGNTKISTSEIEKILDLPKDQIINIKDVNVKVQRLEAEYNKQGYILARVADIRMLPDGTLLLLVNEGIVEDFKVKGNVKTKDYVITREMKLKKGEPFNAKDARRSMQRIYNLGYFEDVNIKLNPGQEPNAVEIEITVVEMNTGTFGIGAGYSNADGFIGMVSVGDRNFRGTGDSVNVRWEFGGVDNKNYEFTYVKPWIDDKETKASIVLYDVTNEYADYDIDANEIARYDKKRRGQELTFSRRTDNEFISNYVTLKNRDDIYKGTADGYEHDRNQYYEDWFGPGNSHWKDYYPEDYKKRREENFGVTRSITVGRVFDSRDNIYDPHEGKRIGYSVEWAGLGGDFDFTKFTGDWRYYYRAGGENVWALNLGAGWADGDMPLSQRFSMGGNDGLRGYEDDQFRGNSMLKATLEYRFPIIKKVQGVLFTDNGYAWDKRFEDDFDLGLIKNSVGVGMRINSPLGPVKLDYGWGDDGGRFHFSFGGQF